MNNGRNPALEAGQKAVDKVIEEHRISGQPLVISPEPGLLQWVVPQDDGSLKVVREERIQEGKNGAKH